MLNRLDLRGVTDDLRTVLPRPDVAGDEPVAAVREVLDAVRDEGDTAVRRFTERWDAVTLDAIRVPRTEVAGALNRIPTAVREALEAANDAVRTYHESQRRPPHELVHNGIRLRSFELPVERAGCYVPGGRAVYPSTVLMSATVAKVAGVGEVVVVCPPDRSTGRPPDATLAASAVAGVDEVYAVGGAQAVAMLAYGTESVRPVDVIVGPGNAYVAIAKRLVAGEGRVGIPSVFAGPSEVVVIADESAPTAFAAIDILVQAEHGPDGLAWLISWDESVLEAVRWEVARLTAAAPRRADLEATFAAGGYAVLVDGPAQAMAVSNVVVPEHLELMVSDPEALLPLVRHAGAVFCGPWTPASVGDYVAGPSHVLPTFGSARFGSALTVGDFTKHVHVVAADEAALRKVGPWVATLAATEGLPAHEASITLRTGP